MTGPGPAGPAGPADDALLAAAARIVAAVRDPGPRPAWHRAILRRHRREWPVLWHAVDALLAAADNQHQHRPGPGS